MAIDINKTLDKLNANYESVTNLIENKFYFTDEPNYWNITTPDYDYIGFADACIVQSDGKPCVAGQSGLYSSSLADNYSIVKRFLASGVLDGGFTSAKFHGDDDGYIRAIGQQSSGKLIVAGHFESVDGSSSNGIARLNTNGSLDNTFAVGNGFNNNVFALKVLSDNSIICAGSFNDYDGTTSSRVAKLNSDGTIDSTFATNVTAVNLDGNVHCVAVDGSGKLYVGGSFSKGIIRLNSDGTADNTFDPGTGFSNGYGDSNRVSSIDLQSSGKIIVGHWYESYNGESTNVGISRLNTDGTLDTGFVTSGTGFSTQNLSGGTMVVKVQSNDKVLVGGWHNGLNGSYVGRLVRLNADGSTDTVFGSSFNDRVHDIALDASGNIFAAGFFTSYNGSPLSVEFNFGNSQVSFGFAKLSPAGVLQGTTLYPNISPSGINDGGEDLTDGGPSFYTNLFPSGGEGGIPHTHSTVIESDSSDIDDMYYNPYESSIQYLNPPMDGAVGDNPAYFGVGSKYFTNMYPGLLVLCAANMSISEFSMLGGTGQDEDGDYAADSFELSHKGKKYACFYKTCFDAGQPTNNHLIIVPGALSGLTQNLEDPTGSDDHIISGLDDRKELFMLYFATKDSHEITASNFQDIATAFLNAAISTSATRVKTCGNQGCGTRKGFVCLVDTLNGGNRCTCASWRYFTAQCTRVQQALGICSGISGGYVPAIAVCNQRLF